METDLNDNLPWWRRYLDARSVVTTFAVVIAMILGWSASQWQTTIPANIAPVTSDISEVKSAETPENSTANDISEPSVDVVDVKPLNTGDYDEQRLLEDMDTDPDAVAARLSMRLSRATLNLKAKLPLMKKKMQPQPKKNCRKISINLKNRQMPVLEAQHDLAALYTSGIDGNNPDYKKAAYWFRKAADQNVANACYNLGVPLSSRTWRRSGRKRSNQMVSKSRRPRTS